MRKLKWFNGLSLALGGIFFFILFAGTAAASGFSADFISKSSDPADMPGTGKMFMKDGLMRMEVAQAVTIVRPDKGIMWILMDRQKMYMEQQMQSTGQGRIQEWTPNMEKIADKVGKETVSGYSCTKYELKEEGPKIYYWISKKISFPVKVQDDNGYMLLNNIKTGDVPDHLFELPQGYKKFAMPGGMPGMSGGMPQMPQGMPSGMPQMPQGMPGMPGQPPSQ